MTLPRATLAILLLALGACGDSGTATPDIDRISVTPDEVAVSAVGATAQFNAQALSPSGAPLSGPEFEWSSSDETVATVDQNGRATAVSVGEAFIRAESDGVVGEARMVVRECGAALDLAPGESLVVDVPGQSECGFILPAGAAGDLYRVAIVRTNSDPSASNVATVALEVRSLGGVAADASATTDAARVPAEPRLRVPELDGVPVSAERTGEHHLRLREDEARMIEHLGFPGPLPSRVAGPARIAQQTAPDRIMIDPATPTLCTPAGTPRPAFKVAENEDMVFYQDSAQQLSLPVSTAQAQQTLDYYSEHGKAIIDLYFGGVPDIDGNGKINVIVHPTVSAGVAAFVWSGDLLPQSECAASNEMELIFFSATLLRALDQGNYQALETIVHEVKHVSSLYHSIARSRRRGQNSFHTGWIEEGVAEIAGNMSSRAAWATVGGPLPNARVDASDIRETSVDGDGDTHPEFWGVLIRLFRVQGYLSSQPNSVVVNPAGAASSHSIYGSGWTWWRWLGDSYGGAVAAPFADAPFFREQNDSLSPPSVEGIVSLTGKTFAELMIEYALAVMTNGTPAPPPARTFTSYDLVSSIEIFCFAADNPPCDGVDPGPDGSFPWPVTTRSDGTMARGFVTATFSGPSGPAGLRIHDLRSAGTNAVEVFASAPAASRIVVVRIQ